jgi:hypothetical protein
MLSIRARIVGVGLVLTGSGLASAQRPAASATTPTAIPTGLVAALMQDRVGGRDAPKIFVDTVPTGYPSALIPPKPARVVGGLSTESEMYAIFEDSTHRVAAILEDLFEQKGYEKPLTQPASGFSPGFPRMGYCGDSGSVRVESLSGPQRHMARVTYQRTTSRAACTGRNQMYDPPTRVRLTIPQLTAPPGARVGQSGGGGGGTEVNSRVQLTGADITPAGVAEHYGKQLVAAGWRGSTPAFGEDAVTQVFEAKDTSGATWTGTLTATRFGSGVSVNIVMRPQPRR